ncbi:MAG: phytanoyl-CoA dioxygenase family protein [Gemmatimonadetes bacterium]|nr:phytanoyl-CoA dioxygenase family protein [Gemmatimonadota bacterium]
MPGLTERQLDLYKQQGYLLIEEVFDPSLFDTLKGELDVMVSAGAERAHAEGRLDDLFEKEPFSRRLARVAEALGHPAELLGPFHGKLRTPGMFEIVTAPPILDIVESVIGPEILAHPQFNLRAKLPGQDEGVVPWHQDLGYLQPDASDTFMVNFWIPMVDATRENGCMEVIAGSHRAPLIPHEYGMGPARNFKGIPDEHLPPGEQVPCEIAVGGVLLIMHKTLHRSIPNRSDHIRWSLDLRYSDPAMPTGRDNVPGFIARSAADPDAVCTGVAQWDGIMASHPVSG